MLCPTRVPLPALVFLALCLASPARSEESELVSDTGLAFGRETVDGIVVRPAPDAPVNSYTEDHAPPQVVEIIRPDDVPITVGRLLSSCSCLRVSMAKKEFGQGERALMEIRNVKPTVSGGATYAVFVQLTEPVRETLQYDVFVRSEPKPPAPASQTVEPPAQETRP